MSRCPMIPSLCLVMLAGNALAQAPGVEIVRDRGDAVHRLVEKATELREQARLLPIQAVTEQLERETCSIDLPEPGRETLTDRAIWERSKAAHVRVGWLHLCKRCDHWHAKLAGGYFISTNGVAVTCHHVLAKSEAYREGYLVAVDATGNVLPVSEVLAASEATDTAIIRVETEGDVTALPLNTDTYPGDATWCYSAPQGRSSYFSKGIINRFYYHKKKGEPEVVRIHVSTDWAPGSSGSAVLDASGNAIGHVSEVSSTGIRAQSFLGLGRKDDKKDTPTKHVRTPMGTVMVFHSAVPAAAVLDLVE